MPGKLRGVTAGDPAHHAGADVGQRAIVAAPAVAFKPRQQGRVLARVIGVVGRRVDAVVGGEDEQVVVAQQCQPVRHRTVDRTQRCGKPIDVMAVAVELVGLHQVDEHEPVVQLAQQRGGRLDPLDVGRARVLDVDTDPGEQITDLADAVNRHPRRSKLLQVRARRRRQCEVAPPVAAAPRARRPVERPGDHPAHGVLPRHDLARGRAHPI